MKNLKKTLSFVLVLAMVLGMVSTAFAADFTDASAITNEEAVAVLEAIDVIDGFTDGSFGPTKTVTRGQACAFICRLLLGRTAADKLTAIDAPFSDVAADSAFAGYIAYCSAQGIVDGYADGTFKPSANVTTIQFGKMILTALGYNSEYEEFTGTGWKTNVLALLDSNKLLTSVTCGYNAGLTREETAQVCFNALDLQTRKFTKANTTSFTVTKSGDNYNVAAETSQYTLGDKVSAKYPKLTKNAVATDAFQRPYVSYWTLADSEGKTSVVYKKLATPVYTSDNAYVLQTGVYKALGLTTTAGITVKSYLNGVEVADAATSNYIAASGSGYAYYFGYGTTNEVYKTGDKEYTVINIVKTAVQASKYDAKKLGATLAGEFVYTTQCAAVDADTKADDWFIVTYANGKIQTAERATLVSGEFQGYTQTNSNYNASIKVDGVTYNVSYEERFNTNGKLEGANKVNEYAAAAANKAATTLVVDENGAVYAAYTTVAEKLADEYIYLTEVGSSTTAVTYGDDKVTYYGKGYLADGTFVEDIKLAANYGSHTVTETVETTKEAIVEYEKEAGRGPQQRTTTATTTAIETVTETVEKEVSDLNKWYTYTVKDEVYTLKAAADTMLVENDNVNGLGKNIQVADGLKASTTTKFIVKTLNASKKAVYTVYTGYNAVPAYTGTVKVQALCTKANSGIAATVIVDATAATLKDTAVVTTDTYFITVGTAYQSGTTSGTAWQSFYYAYNLDGERTTLVAETGVLGFGLYTNLVYDDYGYVKSATKVAALDDKGLEYFTFYKSATVRDNFSTYVKVIDANTVVLSGYAGSNYAWTSKNLKVADDCAVYVYASGAQTVTTVEGLASVIEGFVENSKWGSASYYAYAAYNLNAAGEVTSISIAAFN